jgi:hypothetical protein
MRVQLPTAKPWILKVAAGNCLHASHLDHLATAKFSVARSCPGSCQSEQKGYEFFHFGTAVGSVLPRFRGTLPFQNGRFGNKTTKNEEKGDLRPHQSPSKHNQALCRRHKLA